MLAPIIVEYSHMYNELHVFSMLAIAQTIRNMTMYIAITQPQIQVDCSKILEVCMAHICQGYGFLCGRIGIGNASNSFGGCSTH